MGYKRPNLNEVLVEAIDITQEEAAEVIQQLSKITRFGPDFECEPGRTAKQLLEMETGDLVCMIDILHEAGLIDADEVKKAAAAKREKLKTWSNVIREDGTLNID